MALTTIRDINNGFKDLLRTKIPDLANEDSILFDSPGDLDHSNTPKVSLFLYMITENSFLRNTGQIPVGTDKMRSSPVSLDLHYLLTPYAQNKETEFIIMENILQVVNDYSVLNGGSSGSDLIDTTARITPKELSIDDLNKLWSIFPNKTYRISFAYVVSPVVLSSSKVMDVTRVVTKETNLYRKG